MSSQQTTLHIQIFRQTRVVLSSSELHRSTPARGQVQNRIFRVCMSESELFSFLIFLHDLAITLLKSQATGCSSIKPGFCKPNAEPCGKVGSLGSFIWLGWVLQWSCLPCWKELLRTGTCQGGKTMWGATSEQHLTDDNSCRNTGGPEQLQLQDRLIVKSSSSFLDIFLGPRALSQVTKV